MRAIWLAILLMGALFGEVATEIKEDYDNKIKSLFRGKPEFKVSQSSPFVASDEVIGGIVVEAIIGQKARINGVWCGVGEMCAGRILNEVGDSFVILQDGFNVVRVSVRRSDGQIWVR